MIVREQMEGDARLSQIPYTFRASGASLASLKGGQQQGSENPNDRNNDKQLDQSESTISATGSRRDHACCIS
jgi:hypothetical protein